MIVIDASKISKRGCRMVTAPGSRHIVVLRRGQFCTFFHPPGATPRLTRRKDWFDVLDGENRPILTEREILRNLQAIVTDANDTPLSDVSWLILTDGGDSYDVGTGCPQLDRRPHH